MSHYEDEVDYSEDPLEGVDIWGLDAHDEVASMSDLDPSPEVEVNVPSELAGVEGCNSPLGDLVLFTFDSPSGADIGPLDFSQEGPDTLTDAAIGCLAHFLEVVFHDIGDATCSLAQLSIGGSLPNWSTTVGPSDLRGGALIDLASMGPSVASGVFANIPEDISIPEKICTSSEPDTSVESGLGCTKANKQHRVTKTKLIYITNFGSESGMKDWGIIASKTLVGKVCGRKYFETRLQWWIRELWSGTLDVLPEAQVLTKGWFSLSFDRPEQLDWALKHY